MKKIIASSLLALSHLLAFDSNAQFAGIRSDPQNKKDLLENMIAKHLQQTEGERLIQQEVDSTNKVYYIALGGRVVADSAAESYEYVLFLNGDDANKNKNLDLSEVSQGKLTYYKPGANGRIDQDNYIFEKEKNGGFTLYTAYMTEGERKPFGDEMEMVENVPVKDKKIGTYKSLEEVLKTLNKTYTPKSPKGAAHYNSGM